LAEKTEETMAVLKVLELMADSSKSWEDATAKAIAKASKSVQGISSAWVQDQSVTVADGRVTSYRVTLKVSFVVK
jgi:dodecin